MAARLRSTDVTPALAIMVWDCRTGLQLRHLELSPHRTAPWDRSTVLEDYPDAPWHHRGWGLSWSPEGRRLLWQGRDVLHIVDLTDSGGWLGGEG